jgi:hypothetical protein
MIADGIPVSLATERINFVFGLSDFIFLDVSEMRFLIAVALCVYFDGLVFAFLSPGSGEKVCFLVVLPVARLRIAAFRLAAVLFLSPVVYFLGTFLTLAIVGSMRV